MATAVPRHGSVSDFSKTAAKQTISLRPLIVSGAPRCIYKHLLYHRGGLHWSCRPDGDVVKGRRGGETTELNGEVNGVASTAG